MLTNTQKSNVKTLVEYEEYNKYYDNSVLMQIDANNVSTTDLIFGAETQNENDKNVVLSVYSKVIKNGIVQYLIESGMDEKEDITVTVLDNVLYNLETLEKLENIQNVVLVEKAGSTMYDEVAKEIELLQRNKINVLGGILVE